MISFRQRNKKLFVFNKIRVSAPHGFGWNRAPPPAMQGEGSHGFHALAAANLERA